MGKPLPSEVWDVDHEADATELFVLCALVDYGARAFPKQDTLAKKLRLSQRTVNAAIGRLRARGLVTTKGTGKALTYTVHLRKNCVGTYANSAQVLRKNCVPATQKLRRDPNESIQLAQPTSGAVDQDIIDRIRIRDRRADLDAQCAVVLRLALATGVTKPEAMSWWRWLCLNWARTGTDALAGHREAMLGARDEAAIIRHRIREAA